MTAARTTGAVVGIGAASLAAPLLPMPVQVVVAAIAIGGIGMAHGASDLAIVAERSRPPFVVAYLLVAALCLLWWLADPRAALPVFLAASAIHFGIEDAPQARWWQQAARGAGLIVVPAALHPGDYLAIVGAAAGVSAWPQAAVPLLAAAGTLLATSLVALAVVRRDAQLAVGTALLVLMPPLIGFAAGFLILHALPQTVQRTGRLGLPSLRAYVRMTAPVLGGAIATAMVVAAVILTREATGVRALFAAIAALAMPHLLVTPWFARDRVAIGPPRDARLAGQR